MNVCRFLYSQTQCHSSQQIFELPVPPRDCLEKRSCQHKPTLLYVCLLLAAGCWYLPLPKGVASREEPQATFCCLVELRKYAVLCLVEQLFYESNGIPEDLTFVMAASLLYITHCLLVGDWTSVAPESTEFAPLHSKCAWLTYKCSSFI